VHITTSERSAKRRETNDDAFAVYYYQIKGIEGTNNNSDTQYCTTGNITERVTELIDLTREFIVLKHSVYDEPY
jgi:hypothetical protein